MVKKLKKLAVLLTTVALLSFIGCNNLTHNAKVNSISYDGSIVLSIDSISSRTLAPDTLAFDGTEIDHYKITGISRTTNAAWPGQDIDKADLGTNGAVTINDVPYDNWTFTLTAYGTATEDAPLLQGTTTCNLKNGDTAHVSFNLSSVKLSTLGEYEITLTYSGSDWDTSTYSFTWGLYDTKTGATLTDAGVADASAAPKTVTSTAINNYKATSPSTKVAPGSYIFGVYIYKTGITDYLGYASDILVIEPGRKTTATLALDEKIIQKAPSAPTDFYAQRIVGSEKSNKDGTYDVRFYWNDATPNEESFELILKTFTDTATNWLAYTADNAADAGTVAGEYVYDRQSVLELTSATDEVKYVNGSLASGSTELVLRFPTGTLWDAQIRAKNKIGTSAAIKRKASGSGTTLEKVTDSGTTAETKTKLYPSNTEIAGYAIGTDDANKHISLVQITHSLLGGTLRTSGTVSSKNNIVTYAVYDKQSDAADAADKYLKLFEVTTDPDEYKDSSTWPKLGKNNTCFSGWILPQDQNADNPTKQTYNTLAYKNITVLATYGQSTSDVDIDKIDIHKLAHEDFATETITAKWAAAAADAATGTPVGGFSIPTGGTTGQANTPTAIEYAGYVSVNVTTATYNVDGPKWTKYRLYVGNVLVDEKDYNSTSVTFTPFYTATYMSGGGVADNVRVEAYTSGGEVASSSFYLIKNN